PADQRGQHAHGGDEEELGDRDVGERGQYRAGSHDCAPAVAAIAASAIAASAALSTKKLAAIHASSAAASAAPRRGPFSMPRLVKSFECRGNFGAVQRAGSMAKLAQSVSTAPAGERAHATSTRSTKRSGPIR